LTFPVNETIIMKTVPWEEMPFGGLGDWHEDGNDTLIRTPIFDDIEPSLAWLYGRFIKIHELYEDTLRRVAGIPEEVVNAFCMVCGEEGSDDPKSPIYHEHQQASIVERLIVELCMMKWSNYDGYLANYARRKEWASRNRQSYGGEV